MAPPPYRPYVASRQPAAQPSEHPPFVLLPPYVHGRPRPAIAAPEPAAQSALPSIPSISEFLDELPSIDDFAAAHTAAVPTAAASDWPRWQGEEATPAPTAQEWGTTEWQGYDWSSASTLGGAMHDSAAAQAWADTSWDNPRDPRSSQSAAEALAEALDQIATRIRTGELSVPGTDRVRDDAAIAATLAKLLGLRR